VFLHKPATDKTDNELLQLYRTSQNLEWLSHLYLRYAPLVYGVCLKYLRNRDEAQDAVMQVHEKLIVSLLEHRVNNFKSWLYVTARNHCLMQLRNRRGNMSVELSPNFMETGMEMHPDEEEGPEQRIDQLEKCLERLEGAQRACVRLFYLEEKCYKEVAVDTGFDLNQVKSYIQNGKRNLKNCMDQYGG